MYNNKITKLHIINFKSLKDTGKLEIKPITIFVGPNSSGKSSIFQSILLLRQTMQSRDPKSSLILQDYIDLGSFKDVVWQNKLNNKLLIKISNLTNTYEMQFKFRQNTETIFSEKYRNFGVYEKDEDKINFDFEVNKSRGDVYNLFISNFGDFIGKKYKTNFTKFYKIDIESVVDNILKKELFQNKEKFENIKESKTTNDENEDDFIKKDEKNFLNDIFKENIMGFVELVEFLTVQQQKLENTLNQIYHIGPLRKEPQRVYTASGAFPLEVGKRGEWVVDELISNSGLQKKVKQWFELFHIAKDFKVSELKKGSKRYELIVKDFNTKEWINIADVGFGASQILPIIVEGFLVKDSTLLIEQPEIHLHPKAQAIMGDLIIDVAKNQGNNILIETHSDLIVTRICTRIAQNEIKNNDVAIYYLDSTNNGTEIIEIGINKYGQFQDFPEGFFEERYQEALMKAEYIF